MSGDGAATAPPGQAISLATPAASDGATLTPAIFPPSALVLRARLTPAISVQRAAFSAMLRSVSCTLAGGVTFSAAAIGRV